jgi:hypothetical protein
MERGIKEDLLALCQKIEKSVKYFDGEKIIESFDKSGLIKGNMTFKEIKAIFFNWYANQLAIVGSEWYAR